MGAVEMTRIHLKEMWTLDQISHPNRLLTVKFLSVFSQILMMP